MERLSVPLSRLFEAPRPTQICRKAAASMPVAFVLGSTCVWLLKSTRILQTPSFFNSRGLWLYGFRLANVFRVEPAFREWL